jgi:hypothetical protein
MPICAAWQRAAYVECRMDAVCDELDLRAHMDALRATWQARVLDAARDRMMLVVASILAHSFDEAMWTMFNLLQPRCWDMGRQSLRTPFLTSIGKVDKSGRIVAKVKLRDDELLPVEKVIFTSTWEFVYELRDLADQVGVRLSDRERLEFFAAAKKWLGSDMRLDPTMDPRDPDAVRLVH